MNTQAADKGHSIDGVGVVVRQLVQDRPLQLRRRWFVDKVTFAQEVRSEAEAFLRQGGSITEALEKFAHDGYSRVAVEGNALLNEGINELWTLVCGGGGTAFSNANSYLAVGDSSTAESAAHTGLQAATNKLYKAMDVSYPTYGTSQKATWRATFGSSEANFAWNEFSVANGNSDSAKNLNRKVSAQGTKASGQTWQLTLEITLS